MPRDAQYTNFSGGVNQSLPAEEIADNELADSINFTLDELGHLQTRRGLQQGYTVTPGSGATPAWDAGDPGTPFEHFPAGSTNPHIIVPKGNALYSFPFPAWDGYTDITNGRSLPDGAKWQWTQIDDVAIGVNGATAASGFDNPISVSTLGGGATVSVNAPRGKFIEYYPGARRAFIVPVARPTDIDYHAVGDATDWTTAGASGAGTISVGGDEHGEITGIHVWQKRLFIFKQNAIYMLVPGNPMVDSTLWDVQPYATNVGCVSAWTIQQVGDDVVFLSAQGITSLRSTVGGVGEFAQQAMSLSVPELGSVPKSDPEAFTSVVWPQQFQYWIGVPMEDSSDTPQRLWVMNYRNMLSGGAPAWMPYDGDLATTRGGYVVARSAQAREIVVVSADYPYEYSEDVDAFVDDPESGAPTMSSPLAWTKAFGVGETLYRKEFYFFGMEFQVLVNSAAVSITYRFDENSDRAKTIMITFGDAQSGSELGGADLLTSTFTLASAISPDTDITRSFRGSAGRRGQTIQYRIESTDTTKGFVFRRLKIRFDYLNQGQVGLGDE